MLTTFLLMILLLFNQFLRGQLGTLIFSIELWLGEGVPMDGHGEAQNRSDHSLEVDYSDEGLI